ncbi:hypothetical protein LCGC14_1445350 [marine sediment metagenome]|uniref:Uncharacterized protein n=1 Tax=marine sediment metagenome TaxID=412755 RepID=A0A0F9LZY6_9ZZZZ
MPKFYRKLVVVEAWKWTGGSLLRAPNWVITYRDINDMRVLSNPDGTLTIPTLEGLHKANLGDWIIRGIAGELYPCKPDIFEKTYELVEEN